MDDGTSVIELLLRDHKKAESLLCQLEYKRDDQLNDYFCQLREELVRHEVAEELILYPALRKNVPEADGLAHACLAEQRRAEEALAALEKENAWSPSFRGQLVELRQAVLTHAKHEEVNVFPALERETAQSELVDLGRRYDKALRAAPTHAHPHAPHTPLTNAVVAPVVALVDRLRDAIRAA